jgi:hypothetical protein
MTSVVQSLQSENRQGANPDGLLEQPESEAIHASNHTLLPVGRC